MQIGATPGQRFDRATTGEAYNPESRMHDPRDIKIVKGWNMRNMDSPETLAHVVGLEESIIAAGGVKEPIHVKYDKVTGVRTLVKGQCRLTACLNLRSRGVKLAGEDVMIPCVRVEGDEATLTAENILSNGGLALTQWEAGEGYRRLCGWGWSPEKIAAYIGKPKRYVTDCIALSNVSVDAKAMLSAGQVTPGAVLHAVKEHGPDAAADVLKEEVAARPKPKAPAQASIPGTAKPDKPKPVARPKKPSAREEALKAVPAAAPVDDHVKLSQLAIELARGVIADNVEFVKMERLAFEVLAAAGLKK